MSQKAKILKYLKSGKRITPAVAYEKFGCLRLSERMREIQLGMIYADCRVDDKPHNIKKGWKKINKRTVVREYWL